MLGEVSSCKELIFIEEDEDDSEEGSNAESGEDDDEQAEIYEDPSNELAHEDEAPPSFHGMVSGGDSKRTRSAMDSAAVCAGKGEKCR